MNFGPGSEIVNNVLVGLQSQNAFYCDLSNPVFTNNDVFSANGVPLIGNCSAIAGSPSNISLDPRFAGASDNDYYLLAGSSAIGSGSVAAPGLPNSDFYGNPRITTGVPGCPAIVNMGVSQFQEGVVDSQCPSPPAKPQKLKVSAQSLGFRATTRNSLSRARSITIANPRKNRPADIVLASYGSFADDFLAGNYCPEKLAAGAKCTIFEAFRPTSASPESAQLLIMDGSDTPIATVNLSGSGLSPGAR